MADMVAKAVNGMPTKRAMDWAQEQVALAVKGQLKARLAWRSGRAFSRRPGFPGPAASPGSASGGSRSTSSATASSCPRSCCSSCLVAFPFGMAIYFSLSDYWVGSPGTFVGLENYRDILGNEIFRQTVQNSFVFTAIALALKTVLGVWLAMLLARDLRFKRLDPRRGAPALRHPHRAVARWPGCGCSIRSTAW